MTSLKFWLWLLAVGFVLSVLVNGCNDTRPKVWSSDPQGDTGAPEPAPGEVRMFAGKM